MASIQSYELYEPSPRFGHGVAPVGGRGYLWGGRVQDFSESARRKLASNYWDLWPIPEGMEEAPHNRSTSPWTVCWSLHLTLRSVVLVWWVGWQLSLQLPSWTGHHHTGVEGATTSESGWWTNEKAWMWNGPLPSRQAGCIWWLRHSHWSHSAWSNINFTDGRRWSNEFHVFDITKGTLWNTLTRSSPLHQLSEV